MAIVPINPMPYSGKQFTNITPFTVRDNATYITVLSELRAFINDKLVPFVNENMDKLDTEWTEKTQELIEAWNTQSAALIAEFESLTAEASASEAAAEAAQAAAEAARDLAEQFASDAAEIQDASVTLIFNTLSSELRQALDGEYTGQTEFLQFVSDYNATIAALGTTVSEKADTTYVDAEVSANSTAINGVSQRVTTLETLTGTGRLSESSMDFRYEQREHNPIAVFIGSSNATPGGTWVEEFTARMNYQAYNYSIGGGSFTGGGPGAFSAQFDVAASDDTYAHEDVSYFFICDVGNDIRATAPIQAPAESLFASITNEYPNARIVVLPAVWGNAADNNQGGRLMSISMRYQELVNASMNFDVDLIDGSWLWLADSGPWMKTGEVHCTPAGYSRISDFMVRHMNGFTTQYNQGAKFITPKPAISADLSYWSATRDGNLVTIQNNVRLTSGVNIDTELGQLDYGLWPIASIQIPVVASDRTATKGTIAIFENGLIRSFSAMPAENYNVPITYRAF